MLMLNQGKWKNVTELGNIIMALKRALLRFINRKYCKKAMLNRKQLQRIDLKKHQFVTGTKIFINENLTVKNEHLAFNCRQLKKRNYIFSTFTKKGIVYIKQNKNSRPVVIINERTSYVS